MTIEVTEFTSEASDTIATRPEVSVIIPVYNCERYISETLESVFDQTLPEERLEVIAVDDGSTDDSLAVMKQISEQHPNMRVESIPNSGSASAPRNLGLDLATGEYVFFLDADDKLAEETLERLLEVAEQSGSGVIACKLGPFGPSKRASALPSRAFKKTQLAVDFIDSKAFTTLGALKLFRRSILEEHKIRFPLGYAVGEDQPFTMQAYFHSPHVSILSDRIYYWARGRADGTNVTSIGQPAPEHFKKIKALIEVVASFDLPSKRSTPLLERPTVAPTGFQTVFDSSFLTEFDAGRRKEVVHELSRLVNPLMTKSLRAKGNAVSQIISDLICRDDVESIEHLCRILAERQPIPVDFDQNSQQFVYQPTKGSPITELSLSVEPYLAQIGCHGSTLGFKGNAILPGSSHAPDEISLIWIHRRSGERFAAASQTDSQYLTDRGIRTEFSSTLDLDHLNLSSEWDAFIEVRWDSYIIRERFGRSKGKGISTQPVFFGNPNFAVAFFTKFGNLSVDIGPTREYSRALPSAAPQIVGSFPSPKRQSVIVEGQLSNVVSVAISIGSSAKEIQTEWHRLTETCIAVVMPRRVSSRTSYEIRLIDAEDNHVIVIDTREVPQA
ncbi:glycosyltransferase family 2 protein [Brevibacterium renqingii]|uniref:glycosyltransferase family 2 protein n=1 Tax=Brevibacterium renqingii TaxID=2776916 RepID=UPI001ADF559A|nr:glycosyltransferase [Brevibacterium renqingii]